MTGPTYWETWRDSHKEHLQSYRESRRDQKREYDRRRYATTRRWQILEAKYGITRGDYELLLESQGGMCAICGLPPRDNRLLDVDHCHFTSNVRGLLCNDCNNMLARAYDDPNRLASGIRYLNASTSGSQ